MNKAAVVDAIASKTGMSKKEVEMCVDGVVETVSDSLQKGEPVTFTGFGTFSVSHRKARQGINPATKEKIQIAAVDVPKFKAGKALKDAVRK